MSIRDIGRVIVSRSGRQRDGLWQRRFARMFAGIPPKKNIKHLLFVRKSVPLQADYYQKSISD